jgi:hypothetical protein
MISPTAPRDEAAQHPRAAHTEAGRCAIAELPEQGVAQHREDGTDARD